MGSPEQTAETVDICQQMEVVRGNIGDDVEEIVDSARTLTDWRFYVEKYPWVCLAAAAAAGFSVVPRRVELISPSAETLEQLAKRNKLVVKSKPQPQARSSVGSTMVSLLANAAFRGAMGYLGQNAGQLLSRGDSGGENHAQPNS